VYAGALQNAERLQSSLSPRSSVIEVLGFMERAVASWLPRFVERSERYSRSYSSPSSAL